jgi:hypothetical protein
MVHDEKWDAPFGETDLVKALEKLMPRSLDDVVRANRDKFQIGLATADEVRRLTASIEPAGTKATIDQWRIVAFRTLKPESDSISGRIVGKTLLSLLGRSSRTNCSLITSEVVKIDLKNSLVRTLNSLYRIGVGGEGEPPTDDLIHLCATTHIWQFGKIIGAPEFFY